MKRLLNVAVVILALLAASPAWAGGVTLSEIEELALSHSPVLRKAKAQLSAASARLTQSRAGYWPQLEADASWQRSKNNSSQLEGEYSLSQAGLTLRQSIFDYSLYGASAAAGSDLEAQGHSLESVRLDVILAVRQAFFAVLEAQDLVTANQENLRLTKQNLEQVKAFIRQGLKSKVDLARAARDVATAQLDLVKVRQQVRRARLDLALAVGQQQAGHLKLLAPAEPQGSPQKLEAEPLVAQAQRIRPSILQLKAQQAAAEARLRQAQGGHLPTLSLQAGYGLRGENSLDQDDYSYGLYTSLPLFSGFAVAGQVAEQRALIRSIQAELANSLDQLTSEVSLALLAVKEASEEVELGRAVVALEQENLNLAQARYRANLATPLELSEARLNLLKGRSELVTARYRLFTAMAELDRGLAGTLKPFAKAGAK